MAGWRRQRRPAQDHLVDHEFAVVLAERAGRCAIARVWRIGTPGPLPNDPEGIAQRAAISGHFPLSLCRQILASPAGKSIGLVIAHMTNRLCRIDRAQTAERHRKPGTIDFAPITRRFPMLSLDGGPAVRQPQRRCHITTVGHEFQPFTVCDQRPREPHRPQYNLMGGLLVVEAKPAVAVPDHVNAGNKSRPPRHPGSYRTAAIASRDRKPDASR